MLVRIAFSLLFKKSRHWLMPLSVVVCSVFLLFQQLKAPVEVLCNGGDLWMNGAQDDLMKVRRLNDVVQVSFLEGHIAIKAHARSDLALLKGKIQKATGKQVFTKKEFSKKLFKAHMKGDKTLSLFSVAVMSGLIFTMGIFGATFYYFFKREIPNYSVMLALGVDPKRVWVLIVLQSLLIACMGWGIALALYLVLQLFFSIFFPVSLGIIGISLGSLVIVSSVSAFLVSSRVTYDRM